LKTIELIYTKNKRPRIAEKKRFSSLNTGKYLHQNQSKWVNGSKNIVLNLRVQPFDAQKLHPAVVWIHQRQPFKKGLQSG